MSFVTRRVSFSIGLALMVGWGIFFLLFLAAAKTQLEAQTLDSETRVLPAPGVKISAQTDKRIYRAGETVLLAIRNDSRLPIWIRQPANPCVGGWWVIEQLAADGQTWEGVALSKRICGSITPVRFQNHTLKTDQWNGLVSSIQIGDVLVNASTGTYRASLPYVKSKKALTEWPTETPTEASTPTFTIQ